MAGLFFKMDGLDTFRQRPLQLFGGNRLQQIFFYPVPDRGARIKKIIPWEKLNLTFAGEAENGQQVIDHLEKEPVDLLLLDIKMPHMNGIETARYIKEHFPSVHILILSGYNDFEYARTAIRYGVKEYLLKPVAAEELERALSECIQAIHSEEQTRHTLKHYEHFHLCSMLANIRDGVLSYSDLCVQHPEFENLAYSIYCSVYVSMTWQSLLFG